jgi:hypothetical protein
MTRLIAVAVVITGMMIGSALAGAINTGQNGFLKDLAHTALILYTISIGIAVVLVVALLWGLVRPKRRRRRIDLG